MGFDLRRLAKGRPCQVRAHGICNFDSDTTVLAHIRRGGVGGMGRKPADLCGVWACSACHDAIDGRSDSRISDTDILHGICRTLAQIDKEVDLVKK